MIIVVADIHGAGANIVDVQINKVNYRAVRAVEHNYVWGRVANKGAFLEPPEYKKRAEAKSLKQALNFIAKDYVSNNNQG